MSEIRTSQNHADYSVIDCSNGEKLERWGDVILIRPDPQIIWNTQRKTDLWDNAHGRYVRSKKGGGEWEWYGKIPDSWVVKYKDLAFSVRPTGFKHMGLFPEQAVNWDFADNAIRTANRPISVLNLFAYTGGATLACLNAGASVCHVDASNGILTWAKENAALSKLADKPVRWILDDCEKFVMREIKRGRKYDAVIMDPPSYGRGTNGEVWKLEDKVYGLVKLCTELLSENPLFFIINSYTTGLSPSVMAYILSETVGVKFKGEVTADEIGLPVETSGNILPCGSTAVFATKRS